MERTITESLALYLAQHKETAQRIAPRDKRAPGIWNFKIRPAGVRLPRTRMSRAEFSRYGGR